LLFKLLLDHAQHAPGLAPRKKRRGGARWTADDLARLGLKEDERG